MLNNGNIVIRKGLPEDTPDFINLIWLSEPTLFPAIFGSGARGVIQNLFNQRKNLFSFEHSYFIEVDGTKAGMISGYDWRTEREEELRTGLLLIKYMKLGFFTRILSLLKALNVAGRGQDNEYYISNVAVYPEFRGNKLGTTLLLEAEEEAKRCGVEKSVLDVNVENQGAIRLYNQLGYSVVGKQRKAKIGGREFAFLRMCKRLYCDDKVA